MITKLQRVCLIKQSIPCLTFVRYRMNTRIPHTRPDTLRFMEEIALPIIPKKLPDPVETCYRNKLKQKIIYDQEDITLVREKEINRASFVIASEYDQFRARRFKEMLENSRILLLCQEISIVPPIRFTNIKMQFMKNGFEFFQFPRIVPHLALSNSPQYENLLPPILSFGFNTIYLFHRDANLSMTFKLLKKYRTNILLLGGLVDGRLYNRAGLEELVQLPTIDYFQGELLSVAQAPGSRILSLATHPARLLSQYLDTYVKSQTPTSSVAQQELKT
ncbi:unnamed protein product [Didymodactylos carnosus]|uniref:Large ribosomal subunit protein uL10m n=1 Tax=Didymodactylos carnosus TaxID=1234261 RepID=A0A813W915_9BILA|nr:unnamed protein product [Didymodactylos carnosus]CAF1192294.1 unnamed protein product [Didymodactylos carnosus]CAF3635597.1 unnamed protein product [Didymodactylos carnosus]CAF4002609.1 unnamed protein product [Didymodactylos carnosus]